MFRYLQCWIDPVPRDGPHAMAVDEWLCGHVQKPILRVYSWCGAWASVGYFGNLDAARTRIQCSNWVRRISGGGIVDHRHDWTYTLFIPKSEPAANWRGDASYQAIHQALAEALITEGTQCRLSSGQFIPGETVCFANPADHDLITPDGQKIAGAGQRRSRNGLLHQGSLIISQNAKYSHQRTSVFATALSDDWEAIELSPDPSTIESIVAARYGCPKWLNRR